MIFGLVIVCVLATIGIFICAVLGMKGIKEISERHVHVLRKRTLVNDFIVCDLAAAEGGGSCAVDVEMGMVTSGGGSGHGYGQVPQHDQDRGSSSSSSGVYLEQNGGDDMNNNSGDGEERNYFSAQQQRTLDRMGLI